MAAGLRGQRQAGDGWHHTFTGRAFHLGTGSVYCSETQRSGAAIRPLDTGGRRLSAASLRTSRETIRCGVTLVEGSHPARGCQNPTPLRRVKRRPRPGLEACTPPPHTPLPHLNRTKVSLGLSHNPGDGGNPPGACSEQGDRRETAQIPIQYSSPSAFVSHRPARAVFAPIFFHLPRARVTPLPISPFDRRLPERQRSALFPQVRSVKTRGTPWTGAHSSPLINDTHAVIRYLTRNLVIN